MGAYDYVDDMVTDSGLKIHIHSVNDQPDPKNLGVAFAPGQHANVKISYTKVSTC